MSSNKIFAYDFTERHNFIFELLRFIPFFIEVFCPLAVFCSRELSSASRRGKGYIKEKAISRGSEIERKLRKAGLRSKSSHRKELGIDSYQCTINRRIGEKKMEINTLQI